MPFASFKTFGFNEFEISVEYNKDLIEFFQSIFGHKYNADNKSWIFPMIKYDTIKERILQDNISITNDLSIEDLNKLTVVLDVYTDIIIIKFPYNENVVRIVKQLKAQYNKSKRTWEISKDKKDILMKSLEAESINVAFKDSEPKSKRIILCFID